MNTLNCIKRKMREKRRSVVVGSVASAAVSVTASSSFAAIDYSPVQALITTAVADIVAGGLILVGAYAGFWGIKKVKALFSGESDYDRKVREITEHPERFR